jgi:aspartyl-tRNA(Asn)/glutamyl-tRNA(Gln) amidotransferase subunit B
MGHPGTLPVINQEAIKSVLKVGVALGGKLADFSEFDRKNYFYLDIPKGFQISQYKYPLVSGGELDGVKITRVHLEEDTGTSLRDQGDFSLVDFNRAGVPLMELVTEPVIHDPKVAGDFGRELQLILQTLGVSEANMEKGEMRVEANVSVSNTDRLGTKTEIKNLNSFRSVERAIAYEVSRQIDILEAGESVLPETRGWNEIKQETYSQRKKEESHDYRYFPEPDLPKFKLSDLSWANEEEIRKELPELPSQKRQKYLKQFGLKKEDIEVYVSDPLISVFFENTIKFLDNNPKAVVLASNYIISDLIGILKTGLNLDKISPASFGELVLLIINGKLSSRGAKDTLLKLVTEGGSAIEIANKLGVVQSENKDLLVGIVKKVIESNPKVVLDYKSGKTAALQFLLGQVMKETKGSVNPNSIKDELLSHLAV